MANNPRGVGIIGLTPGRSWAAVAHVPALLEIPKDFKIAGIANSSRESAEKAAAATGGLKAFADTNALVQSPDVDVVAVTVKVPHHRAMVTAAAAAGKHIFCEWPLGNGLAEARELASLVRAKKVLGVVGIQAWASPVIAYLRDLIAEGYVGDVLSTTLVGDSFAWGGGEIPQSSAYLMDRANGATLLTIISGHQLSGITKVLGPIDQINATLAIRRPTVRIAETKADIPVTAADQVVVQGTFASGAPISLHCRGGRSRGTGLLWEITGTKGDLQITAGNGHLQLTDLTLKGANGENRELAPLPIPAKYGPRDGENPMTGNVRRIYEAIAADLTNGTRTAPTFDDAVELHQIITAIEESAERGVRVRPSTL